jgi:hypothetical protein
MGKAANPTCLPFESGKLSGKFLDHCHVVFGIITDYAEDL